MYDNLYKSATVQELYKFSLLLISLNDGFKVLNSVIGEINFYIKQEALEQPSGKYAKFISDTLVTVKRKNKKISQILIKRRDDCDKVVNMNSCAVQFYDSNFIKRIYIKVRYWCDKEYMNKWINENIKKDE